ncbi:hypothetical protein SFC65_19340 [Priestia filamentosa]|uniref:hypothetical protein n=1 Tax=Priestia filamentosa TaxID=1402861 RepID=UPI003982BF55
MRNHFAVDIVIKEEDIEIHLYLFNEEDFIFHKTHKRKRLSDALALLERKASIYYRELAIYSKEVADKEEINDFLEKARRTLNWVVIDGRIRAGVIKGTIDEVPKIKFENIHNF